LAGHLLNHAMQWFWFLIDPTIDATTYRGEQAILSCFTRNWNFPVTGLA
jgi:hypothetical protein